MTSFMYVQMVRPLLAESCPGGQQAAAATSVVGSAHISSPLGCRVLSPLTVTGWKKVSSTHGRRMCSHGLRVHDRLHRVLLAA